MDVQYLVPSVQYLVPSVQYLVPSVGARGLTPLLWFGVPRSTGTDR